MNLFIAIAGNIGVGKSTLTKLLAESLGAKPYFEPVNENPYLADFYQDMARWAYHSQMYFLSRRLKDQAALVKEEGVLIQDRSLYENAEVFARNLYERQLISERDWATYQEIYQTAMSLLRPPDLVVYLQASVPRLVEHIRRRGRDFEQGVDVEYLSNLNRLYDDWVAGFKQAPVLIVPTDEIAYLEKQERCQRVLELIQQHFGGLPMRLKSFSSEMANG